MKRCYECLADKTVCDFYGNGRGGFAGLCKDCHKARMKLRRLTNSAVQEYDRLRYQDPKRKAKSAESAKRWRQEHPDAYRAHTALNNAVRDGRLEKQACQLCSATDSVHAHHKDYSKPLDVKWLCAKCHHRMHSIFPELGGHFGGSA